MVYTTKELSELLKVHENTVYNLIYAKKLEAVKIGTAWRITEESLKKFMDENKTNGGK